MKSNSKLKIVIITVCFVLLCALMVCGFGLIESLVVENRNSGNADNNSGPNVGDVYFDGAWHTINSDVTSLLVIGVDKSVSEVEGKENSEQSDFFALVVINEKSKSYSILHINRDTVTEIKKVDSTGEVLGTFDAQLALSHTFGGNDQMRCRNSVSAVENLLYGTDITHYLSLTMDAVPILNDAAGGVTVELLDDLPS
ncbi:MAG: LCP family protein [Clostridia bacterium]|nr:LCP family protein [Clostridia bacterium]